MEFRRLCLVRCECRGKCGALHSLGHAHGVRSSDPEPPPDAPARCGAAFQRLEPVSAVPATNKRKFSPPRYWVFDDFFVRVFADMFTLAFVHTQRSPSLMITPSRLRSPHLPVQRLGSGGNGRPGSGSGSAGLGGRVGSAGASRPPLNPLVGMSVSLSQNKV